MRLSREQIIQYAEKYQDKNIDPICKHSGFLTKEQFIKIAVWKSPRIKKHIQKNSPEFIKEVTSAAFHMDPSEHFRIDILTLLKGVQYPVASAILHFGYNPKYPILDFRAIWSLGEEQPRYYTPDYWIKYIKKCRDIASENNVNVRTLDKALWQYSKDTQPKS